MDSKRTPEELTAGVRYLYSQVRSLRLEVQILFVEYGGLLDLSSKIREYWDANIKTSAQNDLSIEPLFWKWDEQISRYHGQMNTVRKLAGENIKRILQNFERIRSMLEEEGLSTKHLQGVDLDIDTELPYWQKLLDTVEGDSDVLDSEFLTDFEN